MATYIRLTDYKDSESKEEGFFKPENRYEAKQSDFDKIPGSPIAYWINKKMIDIFNSSSKIIDDFFPSTGLQTGDNIGFIRKWFELSLKDSNIIFGEKWFKLNNGGDFRKWYGNFIDLLLWENNGKEIKNHKSSVIRNEDNYFKKGITWNRIATDGLNMRQLPENFIFDQSGDSLFFKEENKYLENYLLAFFNTKIAYNIMKIVAPTLNITAGGISDFPIIFPKQDYTKQQIDTLTQECIDISKEEWDSRETSWDFLKNELLKHKSDSKLETAYNNYCSYWKEKFYKLHANEEELNRLFIDIYELQDELTPDVALKDITILKSESIINDNNELKFKADEIMKQFISYAVGVMFGRYSLDSDGLVVANLNQDYPKDTTFEIDDDNVIPVLEDDYFSDDIASRIINFVKTTFGAENLSENIAFIEKCLGKTIRAYMVKDFYEDHIKRYKKRPIYWMVSSPKKGFMSLSYMHRYTSDLFARVQNNYLREYITKLEGTKEVLKQTILNESSSTKDKNEADKRIKNIDLKLKELISFDRDVLTSFAQNRVDINLDDGVKVNYNKFKDVLYVIKGLDKE
ncbi:BREX-1 system adenine-specific DNA-methyltransferase PglX [Aliarcobacter butzleri]|uniref:BREX-1 system adenine-specific DNA-methyltransferase PglX n=1 Tax=Aliarcobacter butzleri TaxID=28197 RepID=UPI00263E8CA9|nr:BREX-1 system adenine-specific DNA-methyltransferase PglX [Aliarcobacter butzleri]MDN5081980.1 BREX-1 system adenine-specific DNA-methyltransferase PglX [Aliarcobacter butzleri]MDN5084290.1 BREX-1 system adenine-specific DNA-methyltransferase PglX [Aliarcobacter butzleri]